MAGLNDLISNKSIQQTTLPGWFDTAQQNVVSQAQNAFGAAPTAQNTVAQNAVTSLQNPSNAFTQAGSTLQGIASGAANPWIVDQASGNVTPNTNTALGGLFQAQNQQLNQLMPNVTAPIQGGNIASGQFGSLRGQTAINKAMGDAQAQLAAQQMQAALQNQQTGVQAGAAVGNVNQQNIDNLLKVGQYQQASPFINVSNLGKVVGGIQAPTTVANQTQLSPLNQIGGMINLLQGRTGQGGILGAVGAPNLQGIIKGIGSLFTGQDLYGSPNAGGDAENQPGGFYGGTAPTNPYANMTDAQIQAAIDMGYSSNPSQSQLDYLFSLDGGGGGNSYNDSFNFNYDSNYGDYQAPNYEE
jgi:hypothetical protein